MLKKIIASVLILGLVAYHLTYDYRMEHRVRKAVVQLFGEKGSCSGSHIDINGTAYILTAAHCKILSNKEGNIMVKADDMDSPIPRRVLEEDSYSDLLLIEGLPHRDGLPVAKNLSIGDHLISFTHGNAFKTYRTEGDLIDYRTIEFATNIIENDEQEQQCKLPKNRIEDVAFFVFVFRFCIVHVEEMASTMFSAPGSSGGVIVNPRGEVVGLVSAGGDGYSYSVPLRDIQRFLANWE